MKMKTGIMLAVMMFLQYYIWGAWYVTMGPYMDTLFKAEGQNIVDLAKGATYGAGAIATILSPFFVGMIADRYFAAQKIMGVLHLVGAALLFYATKMTVTTSFYWVILAYSLLYMPTIALSNSVAFAQMTDPGKQFPWIRVFGTLGWIVAGIVISSLSIGASENTFIVAAIASTTLGLLSFILPNTPPKSTSEKPSVAAIFGADAFVLLKDKSFLLFFIAALAECNRTPFDLPEAENELNFGYHQEYSSMKLGFYLFAEYINMIMSSAIMASMYFGGYDLPFFNEASVAPNIAALIGVGTLLIKIVLFIFLFMWIRWTIPRFRYDQLMNLGWKTMIPLALFNLLLTGAVILAKL